MYSLFTKLIEGHGSIIKPPGYELIKRTYQSNLKHITDYYKDRVFYTNNTHLLVRLLNTLNIPLDYSTDQYISAATIRADYVGKFFKLTSDITFGKIHDGIFYGPKIQEIIISDNDYFNIFDLPDWRDIQAVKVLKHPISDLACIVPNGKENSTAEGLAVISINIVLLLYQYRCYLLNQYNTKDEITKGANHFVSSFVLPNMLYSHLELAIFNRIVNKTLNIDNSKNVKKYVFYQTDYSSKIDKELEYVYDKIFDSSMSYSNVLKNIPSIFYTDMQESLIMPGIVRTEQVWWSLFIARLDIIYFLIIVGGEKGIVYNRSLINKLKIDIKRLKQHNKIQYMLPVELYNKLDEKIMYLLNI